MSDSDSEDEKPPVPKVPLVKNSSFHELSDSDEDTKDVKPSSSSAALKRKSSGSPSNTPKKLKTEDRRPPCKYDERCYRKNPSHYKDFKHPGITLDSKLIVKKQNLFISSVSKLPAVLIDHVDGGTFF